MMIQRTLRTLGVVVLGAILDGEAQAAVICVSPAGGACQTKIQDAVTAAGPGDTVSILPGTYFENVIVGVDKEGLQIVGQNKLTVVVDPSPYVDRGLGGNSGPAFRIYARNARLRNLTVRNGEQFAVQAAGDGIVVQGLLVNGANLGGILSQGWYGKVELNEIRNTSLGVAAEGFGTLVRGNLVVGTQVGIRLDADGIQALSNRIHTGQTGILGLADGAVVRLNDLRNHSGTSILISGRSPTVQGNKIQGGGSSSAVDVNCTDCFGGAVSSNVVTGSAGYGILVAADGPGLVVERNTLSRTRYGLSLNGEGIRAAFNTATEIGQEYFGDCIEVFGDRHALVQNTVKACAAGGIYVNGSQNLLQRNVALGTFENGITVDGQNGVDPPHTATTLDGNRPSSSAGQGVAVTNGAQATIVRNNVATKNRLDFCNDGTGTVLSGNTFTTSADTGGTDCVIAH